MIHWTSSCKQEEQTKHQHWIIKGHFTYDKLIEAQYTYEMGKQKGNKVRPVIGTHHGLMHGAQSHQNLHRRGSINANHSVTSGSTRSNFSEFMSSYNHTNIYNLNSDSTTSSGSPKMLPSSNSSSVIGKGAYKVQILITVYSWNICWFLIRIVDKCLYYRFANYIFLQIRLHSSLTSACSSEAIAVTTPKSKPRLKRHYSFSHSTTSASSHNNKFIATQSDPESMVRRLGRHLSLRQILCVSVN